MSDSPEAVRNRTPPLQRHCDYCQDPFLPHPRVGDRQKTCGKAFCVKAHRAAFRRKYRKRNRRAERDIQKKRKESRPRDFWKIFRLTHPESSARNRANSRLKKRLRKAGLQRQLDIVQLIDPPEKLGMLVGFATSHRSLLCECLRKPAA